MRVDRKEIMDGPSLVLLLRGLAELIEERGGILVGDELVPVAGEARVGFRLVREGGRTELAIEVTWEDASEPEPLVEPGATAWLAWAESKAAAGAREVVEVPPNVAFPLDEAHLVPGMKFGDWIYAGTSPREEREGSGDDPGAGPGGNGIDSGPAPDGQED